MRPQDPRSVERAEQPAPGRVPDERRELSLRAERVPAEPAHRRIHLPRAPRRGDVHQRLRQHPVQRHLRAARLPGEPQVRRVRDRRQHDPRLQLTRSRGPEMRPAHVALALSLAACTPSASPSAAPAAAPPVGAPLADASPPPVFTWPAPTGWRKETIPFPLDFAPSLPYRGVEEVRFAPHFFDAPAETYFTYSFAWILDDRAPISASRPSPAISGPTSRGSPVRSAKRSTPRTPTARSRRSSRPSARRSSRRREGRRSLRRRSPAHAEHRHRVVSVRRSPRGAREPLAASRRERGLGATPRAATLVRLRAVSASSPRTLRGSIARPPRTGGRSRRAKRRARREGAR